ncbi:MAG: DUF6495 family protein [Bacteroidia bacterium]
MKYTRIPKDELEELESEFVNFLVVNGITAEDWISIKENEPLNADEIVNQFSDVVWESILRSTEYLDKIETDCAYYFNCLEDKIHLIRVVKSDGKAVKHVASKNYAKTREMEMFEMIQNGCTISDGANYKDLS